MTDRTQDDDALFAIRSDPDARAELMCRYDPLATRLAARFRGRGQPPEDLEQVARLALLNALDRFDIERGVTFSTYATRTIVGELKRHLRDKAWSMRVPRSLKERALRVGRTSQMLTQRLGRSPTIREVAAEMDESVEAVIEAMEAGSTYSVASTNAPVSAESGGSTEVGELLGALDPELVRGADRVALTRALEPVPDRERAILFKRFYEGKTQAEIAAELDLSQMHVSRLLRATLEQLRNRMSEAETSP